MKKLEEIIKKRYYIFILTIGLVIISVVAIINHSINSKNNDANIINLSSKQRYLSQRIINQVYVIDRNKNISSNSDALNKLKELTNEWETSQHYLYSKNIKEGKNKVVDSLFKAIEPYHNKILASSRDILNNPEEEVIKNSLQAISESEIPFYKAMDLIVNLYEKDANIKLQKLKYTIFFLAIIAILILIAEFIFVLVPAFKQFFQKHNEFVKENKLALRKLKIDLETKEAYNKIFIEQAPTAIAMLDNNMIYLAVSKRWISDYKMEGKEIIGRSHYDLFPEIGDKWKENHQKCLNGAIDVCDESPFKRADGSVQWIFWDVRPWYISEGNIGGLLMHTGDITHLKEKDQEKLRIEKILESTNEIARIGTWEVDLIKKEILWSRIVCEIHEVPENYKPDLETAINFFKEGKSRNAIEKAVKEAIEHGTSYDLEVELITAKGNVFWTRAIGRSEFVEGKCIKIFGLFQDVNEMKLSQLALNKAHTELEALFNSESISIITTDTNGVINHFNHGAENLTGYSASEMIGLQKPIIFLLEEEFEKFKNDIAKLYNKDPLGFHPQLELANQNAYDIREWTYIRKDGSSIPVQLTLSGIKDKQGKNIGFLGISTDVSEKRSAQYELLRKNQLLNFAEEISMMGNWSVDVVNNTEKWSANLYRIFELDENTEITTKTFFSFIHPEDKERVAKHLEKSLKDKKFTELFFRLKLRDGTIKTILNLAEIITDNLGNVIEMIGTCQDVTEQRMAENKFRGLLESAPDAMVIVNGKGKIQLINKQSEKLFGYSAKELLDKPVYILIPERFANISKTFLEDFFSNPKTKGMREDIEFYGLNKNGTEIPVQISFSPIQTEGGLLVSSAIRDITARKLAAHKIIVAKENLEVLATKLMAQNTQLADFAHITSHNLRAPVSNLNSLLDFYHTSESEEDKASLFKKFEKVINHLTLTLNTLVEAIKIKRETSKNLEDITFDEVLNRTKEILSGEILKTSAVIKSDFSKINKISYNKIYLESIFLNLVGNAIKYRSDTRVPEIFIESEIEDGKIRLKFKDNGMGIDLEMHGHKLFGLNKVFHRHPEAKGVGLFMTKTQVEAMGGTIYATSEVNVGTIFIIHF